MLTIRLPKEIEARLDALAKSTGRTKTFYVREAILEHLEDLEDYYVAEQRMADLEAGLTQTIPFEEVMKEYGLED